MLKNPLDPLPSDLRKVEGIDKLRRLIDKELRSPNVNEKSSNLPHLFSILKCVRELSPLPSAVLKPFSFSKGRTNNGRLTIDIVSSGGQRWYKVSARNPKALNLLAAGEGNFGQRTIIHHVQDYLDCAKENLCVFKEPKITATFTSGIGESLAEELESLGVTVEGQRIPEEELEEHPRIKEYEKSYNNHHHHSSSSAQNSEEENEDESVVLGYKNPSLEGITKLNLDIPALLAAVSNLTNGHSEVPFTTIMLAEQAQMERERPQKPVLDKVFEGRELYCCETAMREFQYILSTVGGAEEKRRAEEFLKRVKVVPDQMSNRVGQNLGVSGNIKERSLVIFGTGDAIQAVTVTANSGFVRAAKTQGVELAAFVHESRALTEQKEELARMKMKDNRTDR